jgi:hypothetical protein
MREGGYVEDPNVDGRITLKWTFKRLIWLRIGRGSGLL